MANNTTSSSADDSLDTGIIQISEETYEQFAFICNTIATPIVCLLGLIGGCLSIGVLYKDARRQKLSIYLFLCALTFTDTVYLLLGLVRAVPNFLKYHDERLATYIDEHMKLGAIYLDMVFSHSSAAMIVVMSLERCLALMKPFTVKNSWLSKYPKQIIVFCFVFNIIFLLPYALYFEVKSYQMDNITDYFFQFQPEVVDAMDTFMLVQTIVDYFFPTVVLILINVAIVITFSRIRKTRERTLNVMAASMSHQQTKITVTVVVITILYFLLSIPNLTIKILAFIDKEYSFDGKYKVAFWLFIDISNIFAYLNAANDGIVYILVSSHYRAIFKDMYCACLTSKTPETSGIADSMTSDQNGDSSQTFTTSSRY